MMSTDIYNIYLFCKINNLFCKINNFRVKIGPHLCKDISVKTTRVWAIPQTNKLKIVELKGLQHFLRAHHLLIPFSTSTSLTSASQRTPKGRKFGRSISDDGCGVNRKMSSGMSNQKLRYSLRQGAVMLILLLSFVGGSFCV